MKDLTVVFTSRNVIRIARHCLLLIAVCVLSTHASPLQISGAAENCDAEVATKQKQILAEYLVAVSKLADEFRLQGHLENTLAVKREAERFQKENALEPKHVVEQPVRLRELQMQYLELPKSGAVKIAQTWVVRLEEAKRKFTIDGKLDEAVAAKAEIENIQAKYAISNPTKGVEIAKSELPATVAMLRDVSLPLKIEGQYVGMQVLKSGEVYRLVKVEHGQAALQVGSSVVLVSVESTDLIQRVKAIQKGTPEATLPAKAPNIPESIEVSGDVDENSELILERDGLFWRHISGARPGQHTDLGGSNRPTLVNGEKWTPLWSRGSATPQRVGDDTSSKYPLRLSSLEYAVELVNGRAKIKVSEFHDRIVVSLLDRELGPGAFTLRFVPVAAQPATAPTRHF